MAIIIMGFIPGIIPGIMGAIPGITPGIPPAGMAGMAGMEGIEGQLPLGSPPGGIMPGMARLMPPGLVFGAVGGSLMAAVARGSSPRASRVSNS